MLDGFGVQPGMRALINRNRGQLLFGCPVQMHVTPKGKRKRSGWIKGAVGGVFFEQGSTESIPIRLLVRAVHQQDVLSHAGVEQQGGVLNHITAGCPRGLDRATDLWIETEHQPHFEIIALPAVAGLNE